MRRKLLIAILVAAALIAGVAACQLYVKEVPVTWTVVKGEGIRVIPEEGVDLGEIAQGSCKQARFRVKNVSDMIMEVNVTAPMCLCGWTLDVEPDNFILDPGEERIVAIELCVGYLAEPGEYNATVVVSAMPIAASISS